MSTPSTAAAWPRLPLALYRLRFIAQETVRLPAYAGSAWRGVFGRALKRLVCVTREPACPPCLLYHSEVGRQEWTPRNHVLSD